MSRMISVVMVLIGLSAVPALSGNAQEAEQQAPQVPTKDDPSHQLALKQAEVGHRHSVVFAWQRGG